MDVLKDVSYIIVRAPGRKRVLIGAEQPSPIEPWLLNCDTQAAIEEISKESFEKLLICFQVLIGCKAQKKCRLIGHQP